NNDPLQYLRHNCPQPVYFSGVTPQLVHSSARPRRQSTVGALSGLVYSRIGELSDHTLVPTPDMANSTRAITITAGPIRFCHHRLTTTRATPARCNNKILSIFKP